MALSRREALLLGGAVAIGGAVASSGCGRVAAEVRRRRKTEPWSEPKDPKVARLLDRMTFGWSANEESVYTSLGHQAYVEKQLAMGFQEPLELTLQLQNLDCLRMQGFELIEIPKPRVIQQLQAAAILRAVYSPNQLRERMVDFWSNHFNIYSGKSDAAFYKGNQEELIVRKEALGNFHSMARGMAKSPAMLLYLDNNQNGKKGPNENYARELLELHTLGIHGGYTQEDVQEVSRCLTGWTIEERNPLERLGARDYEPRARGSFWFNKDDHDDGAKIVLGVKIPAGGGVKDGEMVLDIALNHPSTGKHLARKLVMFFTGSRNEALESTVSAAYKSTQGDIKTMVKPILESEFLHSGAPILRRPFEFMCASLRHSAAITDGGNDLQAHLRTLGQAMYEWPMPDGYPTDQLSWTNKVLPRWQFAYDLAHGKIPNTMVQPDSMPIVDGIKSSGSGLSAERQRALALKLSSPQFQYM